MSREDASDEAPTAITLPYCPHVVAAGVFVRCRRFGRSRALRVDLREADLAGFSWQYGDLRVFSHREAMPEFTNAERPNDAGARKMCKNAKLDDEEYEDTTSYAVVKFEPP